MPEGTRAILAPFLVTRQLPIGPNANMYLEWDGKSDDFLHGAHREFSKGFEFTRSNGKYEFVMDL